MDERETQPHSPVKMGFRRIIVEPAPTWKQFIMFAIYVFGISGSARILEMEKYLVPDKEGFLLQLRPVVIEIYKTVIGSLQSIARILLIFFVFALLGYVVILGFEFKQNSSQ